MFPQSMASPEFRPEDSTHELADTLEQHLLAGFPSDLALDLVLNELVVRAAETTRASGAALALARGDQMVCRAATGKLAPGLGVPLNTRDGLSGACLQTRLPQFSVDTELDSRVDREASRRLGIRSVLIVPVFRIHDGDVHTANAASNGNEKDAELMGIIEVFSAFPDAFSQSDQKALQGFAEQCAHIRVVATELSWHKPAAGEVSDDFMPPALPQPDFIQPSPDLAHAETLASDAPMAPPVPAWVDAAPLEGVFSQPSAGTHSQPTSGPANVMPPRVSPARSRYEIWSVAVGGLAIAAIVGVSFMIGSRIGWLRHATSHVAASQSASTTSSVSPAIDGAANRMSDRASTSMAGKTAEKAPEKTKSADKTAQKATQKSAALAASADSKDELVVYEKGKVVFRMKNAPADSSAATSASGQRRPVTAAKEHNAGTQDANAIVEASSTTRIASAKSVWLSPQEAEQRLLSRTEPQFPPEAVAAHHTGNVILEVHVAEDGTVASIHTLSGDPILASAATEAVRNWRYQPYRQHNHTSEFQTDVTLSFALPD
jgi:TonB family protein